MIHLRLVTFNIAHGRGLTPIQGLTSPRKLRLNLRRIAALIGRLGPDVVALQEVDECSRWAGNFDHLDYIKVHVGSFPHSVFGINNRRVGLLNLCYGNGLLSRHPVERSETVVFGQRRIGEKGFLFTEIRAGGRLVPLVNLHLHSSSRRQRMIQLESLVAWLRARRRDRWAHWSIPPVICGDFNNSSTRDDATAALLSHLSEKGAYTLRPAEGGTFPSPMPTRRLDFVLLPPACRHVQCRVVRTMLSDHCPVLVDFSIP